MGSWHQTVIYQVRISYDNEYLYSPLNANELVVEEAIVRVYNKNPNLDILVRVN